MTRARWLAAAVLMAALAGLLVWQRQREHLMATCEARGGVWDGQHSACRRPLPSPILRRDLERS